jgi:replicative DNA helicase
VISEGESNVMQGHFQAPAPSDLELERTLLAAVIADNAMLDKIPKFQAEMLFDPTHSAIYAAMLDLRDSKRPINLVTLKPRFGATPFATGGTVFEYIKTCEFAGTMPSIVDVADSLTELHMRRQIMDVGERLTASAWDQVVGPGTLLTSFLGEMRGLQEQAQPAGRTRWTAAEAVDDLLETLLNGKGGDRIPNGFVDLDDMTGGWHRSNYVVIAGRPSMGKTALAVACARRAALAGHGVGIFSLEMSKNQWMTRTICDAGWVSTVESISLKNALRNDMSPAEFERFGRAAKSVHGLPIKIDERSGLSVEDIAAGVRQMAEEFRQQGKELRVVIVDHMGKVRPSGRYKGNRVQEVTELSNAFHEIAKAERLTMIILCQLNRAVEGRDNKRAGLSDLRESGAIEQDADVVLFPYRPAYYLERAKEDTMEGEAVRLRELNAMRNLLEINIGKQRNGPTGGLELFTDMSANAIRDAVKSTTPIYSMMER